MKKSEKEKYDCKKNLEGKENAVEKLRKERDELWAIVNTDKYKNIKQVETERDKEREKFDKIKSDLETALNELKQKMSDE